MRSTPTCSGFAVRRFSLPLRSTLSSLKCGVKRPALSWGSGGDASPHRTCAPARLLFFLGFAGGFAFDVLAAASFGEFFKEG